MRLPALAAVVAALLVASCTSTPPFAPPPRPDPHNPNVFVDHSYIVVDQDPIVIGRGDTRDIVWSLPRDSSFSFPDNGITIANAGDEFRCMREADKQRFVCKNRNSKPGRYKYTIRVLDGSRELEPLDPTIANG